MFDVIAGDFVEISKGILAEIYKQIITYQDKVPVDDFIKFIKVATKKCGSFLAPEMDFNYFIFWVGFHLNQGG
jgi:hypothetical protein